MPFFSLATLKSVALITSLNGLLASAGGSSVVSSAVLSGLLAYMVVRLYMRNKISMVMMVGLVGVSFFLALRYFGVGV